MLKNKKGLSGIVMTIILIALVLIAAAIVWAVVANMLETRGEAIDVQSRCLGILLEPTALGIATTNWTNVTIERASGSTSEEFGGVGITVINGTDIQDERTYSDNIAASKVIDVDSKSLHPGTAKKVQVRIYFKGEDDVKVFCPQIAEFP